MFEEINIWDIIDGTKIEPIIVAHIRKREKNNTMAFKIIKQGVSSKLHIIMIGERNK